MNEERVSGNIYAQKESIAREGELYVIRDKTGQGWGLPVVGLHPEDLRILADRIEQRRLNDWVLKKINQK